MQKFLIILTFLPAALFGSTSWTGKAEGDFSVEVTLSTTTLAVDETLNITLHLKYPDTHTVNLDKIRINILKYAGLTEPPFALIEERVENISQEETIVHLQLDPLLEGFHFLSLYDVVFPPKNPETDFPVAIVSKIFEVETTLPTIDKNYRGLAYPLLSLTKRFPITITPENRKDYLENPKIQEAEDYRNVRIFEFKTIPWAELSGVFLFLIILLIARMQPKRRPDLKKQIRKQTLTARKKAIKALSSLEDEKLPQKNEFERYYVDLTHTVRKYIEENYQIRATTKTTMEFLETIISNPSFDEETKLLLQDFLRSSDKVKFAEHQPTLEECHEAHQMAKQFIEQAKSPAPHLFIKNSTSHEL